MAQHCGQRFQVHRRVERVIDEPSGRMLEFRKNAYISLEGLFCTSNSSISGSAARITIRSGEKRGCAGSTMLLRAPLQLDRRQGSIERRPRDWRRHE